MKRDLYCDLDFWDHLCNLYENKFDEDLFSDETDKNRMVKDFLKLIYNSNSYLDCSPKDFLTSIKKHELSECIWKRSTDGRCNLDFLQGKINDMKTGSCKMNATMYNSLFFTIENCKQEANNVGVINVCKDNLFDNEYYFEYYLYPFKQKNKFNHEEWFKDAKHNHNSMIIIDNYIWGNDTENDLNLYKILDLLLPEKLTTCFYLSIFTLGSDIDNKKKELEKGLKKIRQNLNIKIEVFESTKDNFHDRWILTNYMYICSGYGFKNFVEDKNGYNKTSTHINVKAKKTTGISFVYPYLITNKTRENYKKHVENIIDDCKKRLKEIDKSSINRLLR